MTHSKYKQLKTIVDRMDPGTVMVITDFVDVAQPKTVSKMLTRLEEEGAVERVLRSVYWKPDKSLSEPNPRRWPGRTPGRSRRAATRRFT